MAGQFSFGPGGSRKIRQNTLGAGTQMVVPVRDARADNARVPSTKLLRNRASAMHHRTNLRALVETAEQIGVERVSAKVIGAPLGECRNRQ